MGKITKYLGTRLLCDVGDLNAFTYVMRIWSYVSDSKEFYQFCLNINSDNKNDIINEHGFVKINRADEVKTHERTL